VSGLHGRAEPVLVAVKHGAGFPTVRIETPTNRIPVSCMCTWTVVRPGAGMACRSVLRYINTLCPYRHIRDAERAAMAAEGAL
jgi:hypothetical protein